MRKAGLGAALILVGSLLGCVSVKKRTEVPVPPSYAAAREASLPELVDLVDNRYAGMKSLKVSSFNVQFTGGGVEQGYLEKYHRAQGFMVAQWPDSIYVNIQNPLTHSTVVAMATQDETFQIWVPSENKYLYGRTDVVVDEKNPLFNVRPDHLLPAILVKPVPPVDSNRIFLREAQDERFKYYVLSIVGGTGQGRPLCLERDVWIERSALRLVRQDYYDCGQVVSVIRYQKPVEVQGEIVNTSIDVSRKREHYEIHFDLDPTKVTINQVFQADVFEVPQPPQAKVVEVKGTGAE